MAPPHGFNIKNNPSFFAAEQSRKLGRRALDRKDFKAAENHLAQAFSTLSKIPPHRLDGLVSILDEQVEAQIRLKSFDAALKSAQNMVRQNEQDPRGYLRCGQILRKKKLFTKAKRFYLQGIKRAARDREEWQLLAPQLATCIEEGKVRSTRFCDPFASLPFELLDMIVDFLDMRQITVMLRVCRSWCQILLSMSHRWRTLDFRGSKRGISPCCLRAYLRRLGQAPLGLYVDTLSSFAHIELIGYLHRWHSLEQLSINFDLFQSFPTCLTRLPFFNSRLKSLCLGDKSPITLANFLNLLYFSTSLEEARISAVIVGGENETKRSSSTVPMRRLELSASFSQGSRQISMDVMKRVGGPQFSLSSKHSRQGRLRS